MIPDRLQYFLDDFWNDQKCDQIWTLGPRQSISKNTTKYGDIFEIYYFHMGESETLKVLEGLCTWPIDSIVGFLKI